MNLDGDGARQPEGDAALFAAEVQPAVERHCAYLGCHGHDGIPLSIFAVNYMRLRDPEGDIDPETRRLDEKGLAAAEIDHNRRGMAAWVDADDPERTTLVRVLVPAERGGLPHAGVVVFPREDDPDLRAIVRWAATVTPPR